MLQRYIITFAILLIFVTPFFAQSSTNVNFTSLKVKSMPYVGSGRVEFNLQGVDSNGQSFQFLVLDSDTFHTPFPFDRCSPCSPPKVYRTDLFPNPVMVQNSQTGPSMRFDLTLQESPPVYLNSLFFSRKHNFFLVAKMKLYGKIVISNNGQIVASDDDVRFEGTCSIEFSKPWVDAVKGKDTSYQGVEYVLTDPGI